MNSLLAKFAEALPVAMIVFIPIYLILRKKVNQAPLWGILGIIWLVLTFVLP